MAERGSKPRVGDGITVSLICSIKLKWYPVEFLELHTCLGRNVSPEVRETAVEDCHDTNHSRRRTKESTKCQAVWLQIDGNVPWPEVISGQKGGMEDEAILPCIERLKVQPRVQQGHGMSMRLPKWQTKVFSIFEQLVSLDVSTKSILLFC